MMGRPATYDADDVADKLNAYIDSTPDPILPEFCSIKGNPSKDTIYRLAKDNQNLSDATKRLVTKQEAYLIRQADKPIMAIFRLKQPQHGYTDKQQIDQNITQHTITVQLIDDADTGKDSG